MALSQGDHFSFRHGANSPYEALVRPQTVHPLACFQALSNELASLLGLMNFIFVPLDSSAT